MNIEVIEATVIVLCFAILLALMIVAGEEA